MSDYGVWFEDEIADMMNPVVQVCPLCESWQFEYEPTPSRSDAVENAMRLHMAQHGSVTWMRYAIRHPKHARKLRQALKTQ